MKSNLRLIDGRKLLSPIGNQARPTTSIVREAVMHILGEEINNSTWLDLFSGSGIVACEAIQKGAKIVLAIELNKKVYNVCNSNLVKVANANQEEIFIQVINTEVNRFLKAGSQKYFDKINTKPKGVKIFHFDFIYIDPPYQSKFYYEVLNNLLTGDWVSEKGLAICEFSIKQEIDIPSNWIVKDRKQYGKTGLLFLSPTRA